MSRGVNIPERLLIESAEAAAAAVDLAKKKARRTMQLIVGLAILSMVAVIVLALARKLDLAGQVITIMAPTVAALLAYRKSTENAAAIHQVTLNIDGRLSQLLERTDAAARAEGHAAGVVEEGAASPRQVRATDIPQGEQ